MNIRWGIYLIYHMFYTKDLYNFEIGPDVGEETKLYPEMQS
jgi:hypothetical protein